MYSFALPLTCSVNAISQIFHCDCDSVFRGGSCLDSGPGEDSESDLSRIKGNMELLQFRPLHGVARTILRRHSESLGTSQVRIVFLRGKKQVCHACRLSNLPASQFQVRETTIPEGFSEFERGGIAQLNVRFTGIGHICDSRGRSLRVRSRFSTHSAVIRASALLL